MDFFVDNEIPVAAIISAVGLFVSVFTFALVQRVKRRDQITSYAAELRRSALRAVRAADRWIESEQRLYSELQPFCVDADRQYCDGVDTTAVRDDFWKNASSTIAQLDAKRFDENLVAAISELGGYDPSLRAVCIRAVEQLQVGSDCARVALLHDTQHGIVELSGAEDTRSTSRLGNRLRDTCAQIEWRSHRLLQTVIEPLKKELYRLVDASDQQIHQKRVRFGPAEDAIPSLQTNNIELHATEKTRGNNSGDPYVLCQQSRGIIRMASSLRSIKLNKCRIYERPIRGSSPAANPCSSCHGTGSVTNANSEQMEPCPLCVSIHRFMPSSSTSS